MVVEAWMVYALWRKRVEILDHMGYGRHVKILLHLILYSQRNWKSSRAQEGGWGGDTGSCRGDRRNLGA